MLICVHVALSELYIQSPKPSKLTANDPDNPACATVTSFGLPVASDAVTRIIPERADVPVLAEKEQETVPALLPLVPDEIESQLPPDVTAAVHVMVPVPVLETLNVVVPEPLLTSRLVGVIANTDSVDEAVISTLTVTGMEEAGLTSTNPTPIA